MNGKTDLIHMLVHRLGLRLAAFEPPLRPVHICVLAKHALVSVEYPRIQRDARVTWVPLAIDFGSRGGHVARDVDADGGADPHGFFERGLEVGELLCFLIRDHVRKPASGVCGVDLGADLVVDRWNFQDMVDE